MPKVLIWTIYRFCLGKKNLKERQMRSKTRVSSNVRIFVKRITAKRRIFPQATPLLNAQDSDLRSIGQVKSRRKVWQTRRRTRSSAGVSWLGGISFPRRLPANATLPPYRGRRRRRRRRRFVFLRSLLPVPVPVPASPRSPPPFPTLFPRSTSSPLNTSRLQLHAALPLSLRRSLFYFRSFPNPVHFRHPPFSTVIPTPRHVTSTNFSKDYSYFSGQNFQQPSGVTLRR